MSTPVPPVGVPPIAVRTRGHITRRLMPFLFILYVVSYLDRVNVSYAALEMPRDLGFSNSVFGFGAGVFFLGYFMLQIPATLTVELWSARKIIAVIVTIWGLLAALTGLITNAWQFYTIRFLLGAAEAGFFPGVIVYLTHWYRDEDRAKAVAMFMTAIPIANIVGAPLAALLMQIHWLGYGGWRWLLILEGIPAVVFGSVTLFYLTDWPKDARWLPPEERQWITQELAEQKQRKRVKKTLTAWQALRNRQVILLALAYFFMLTGTLGFVLWLPTLVKKLSGLSTFQVTLITAIPWLAALPAMLVSGWHSDKKRERRWHVALPIFAVAAALACSQVAGDRIVLAMAMFTIAAMGMYSYVSPFWAVPTLVLSEAAAAAAVGLINSVGNLGGFVGPYAVGFLSDWTGDYRAGVFYLVGSVLVAGVLVLVATRPERRSGVPIPQSRTEPAHEPSPVADRVACSIEARPNDRPTFAPRG